MKKHSILKTTLALTIILGPHQQTFALPGGMPNMSKLKMYCLYKNTTEQAKEAIARAKKQINQRTSAIIAMPNTTKMGITGTILGSIIGKRAHHTILGALYGYSLGSCIGCYQEAFEQAQRGKLRNINKLDATLSTAVIFCPLAIGVATASLGNSIGAKVALFLGGSLIGEIGSLGAIALGGARGFKQNHASQPSETN